MEDQNTNAFTELLESKTNQEVCDNIKEVTGFDVTRQTVNNWKNRKSHPGNTCRDAITKTYPEVSIADIWNHYQGKGSGNV